MTKFRTIKGKKVPIGRIRKKLIVAKKKGGITTLPKNKDEFAVFIPTTKGVVHIGNAKNEAEVKKIGERELTRLKNKGKIKGVVISDDTK